MLPFILLLLALLLCGEIALAALGILPAYDLSRLIDKAALALLCFAGANLISQMNNLDKTVRQNNAVLRWLVSRRRKSAERLNLAPDAPQWDDIIAPRQDVRPGAPATRQKISPGYEPLRRMDRIYISRRSRSPEDEGTP
jgi:hypothetical protein